MILENIQEEIDCEQRPPRMPNTFRGSELGDCPRAIQYSLRGTERKKIDPQLALLFRDGHLHHNDLRSLIARTGTTTNVEQGAAKDFIVNFKGQEYPITLTITPDLIYERDYVVDIKSCSRFVFKWLSDDWISKKHAHYLIQLNTYLNIFDKPEGCILYKCKDTSELYQHWHQYDEKLMEEVLSKLGLIVYAQSVNRLIKRPFSRSSKDCKRCPFRKTCWGIT